jgi:hypothetical protein
MRLFAVFVIATMMAVTTLGQAHNTLSEAEGLAHWSLEFAHDNRVLPQVPC